MKILITDDHAVVRLGMTAIIKELYANAEIHEAENEKMVYEQMKHTQFNLMLLDLNLPDSDSMNLMQQSMKLQPKLRVLIVSTNPENLYAIRYIQAGAAGYLQKNEDIENMKNAIKCVVEGKTYLTQNVVELMTNYMKSGSTINPFEKLSKREFEVAIHFINGKTPGEVCKALSIQSPTVTIYKNRIFEKLNIRSTYELMAMAKQYGAE